VNIKEFPHFIELVQNEFPSELMKWITAKEEYFMLFEHDLESLKNNIDIRILRKTYDKNFTKVFNVLETIYEIHFGALLANHFDNLELTVSTSESSNKNFDFRVGFNDAKLNFEVKTRIDAFPFRGKKSRNSYLYFGRQETIDKKFKNQVNKGEPESNNLRQILSVAKDQLPDSGFNFIAIGQVFCHSDFTALYSLKNALFGDLVQRTFRRIPGTFINVRYENGIFYNNRFNKIVGVVWFRLKRNKSGLTYVTQIFFNGNCNEELDIELKKQLQSVFNT